MRIVFGIALALLLPPAAAETLVERGAYLVNSVMVSTTAIRRAGHRAWI